MRQDFEGWRSGLHITLVSRVPALVRGRREIVTDRGSQKWYRRIESSRCRWLARWLATFDFGAEHTSRSATSEMWNGTSRLTSPCIIRRFPLRRRSLISLRIGARREPERRESERARPTQKRHVEREANDRAYIAHNITVGGEVSGWYGRETARARVQLSRKSIHKCIQNATRRLESVAPGRAQSKYYYWGDARGKGSRPVYG